VLVTESLFNVPTLWILFCVSWSVDVLVFWIAYMVFDPCLDWSWVRITQ